MRRPPTPASELRSYEVMLGNAFHLFRVVGRERLDVAGHGAARSPTPSRSPWRSTAGWSAARPARARDSTAIRARNRSTSTPASSSRPWAARPTCGGARREVEALTSFYALLILDRAVERTTTPTASILAPRSGARRDLLEAQPLVFGDRYRALLDEMEARWSARSP